MKAKYNLGGLTFSSKAAIRNHVRGILYRYPDDESLGEEDLALMTDLLGWHPWHPLKRGSGLKRIFVRDNHTDLGYVNRSFWLERLDGSVTDFSYVRCLEPPNAERDFKKLCRDKTWPTFRALATWCSPGTSPPCRSQSTATCMVIRPFLTPK